MRESRTIQAQRKLYDAGRERKLAACGGPASEAQLQSAEELDAQAAALMLPVAPPTIRSGEVFATIDEAGPVYEIQNTLRDPKQTAIDASVERTGLLLTKNTDLVAIAIDAAESIKAGNSLEKMLAHQLAQLHVLAMKTGARAMEFEKRHPRYSEDFAREDSIELGRLANTCARLTAAFQEGMLTLQRIKSGASQTVTVRHVTVQSGGQAVIGNVKTRVRRSGRRARGEDQK
jgi:hypothetical protein